MPVTVRSVRVSPPAAAATLSSLEIEVTSAAPIDERVKSDASVLSSIFDPAFGLLALPTDCLKLKPNPPPAVLLVVGALVTVMSVPTPYSECKTDAWAFLTPAAAAVTVITSPIPSASPIAMKMAWRARRRNSRQRYVKNIRLLSGLSRYMAVRTCRNRGSASDPGATSAPPRTLAVVPEG